jgi:hypothetical protein
MKPKQEKVKKNTAKSTKASRVKLERVVRRFARCEDCHKKIPYGKATAQNGWFQSGLSRYGVNYCPDGIGWHCGCKYD